MSSPTLPELTGADVPDAFQYRFRPWRTLRFALIVALGFTLLNFALSAGEPAWQTLAGWWHGLRISLVFSLLISFTIHGLFLAGAWWLRRRLPAPRPWQRALFYWGTPALGLAIALPLAATLAGVITHAEQAGGGGMRMTPLGAVAFMVLTMSLFYGYFAVRAGRLRAEKRAAEAQLKLLQGQIEPHFLFNTLANVRSLMDADPPRAKQMLESFVDYLRCSLGSLRHGGGTLGDELALVQAYLSIVAIRMEDRLRVQVDVADALRATPLPPLTLQPLVENAILHGLEPAIDGGTITIRASQAGRQVAIDVIDDGIGLREDAAPRHGHGQALAIVRERLWQTHGDRASLQLAAHAPRGTRATLSLPARPETPSSLI